MKHGYSFCMVDCEDYELAVPHSLFMSDNLDLDPILVLERSTIIPGGVIGKMEFLPVADNDGIGSDSERNRRQAIH